MQLVGYVPARRKSSQTNCTLLIGRLSKHAKALIKHTEWMREMQPAFDKVSPLFEKFSSKEGKSYQSVRLMVVLINNDGRKHTLLCASLDL